MFRFMWVRAQIDYLQRLPSDIEKQRALNKLPPDLPRTYIQIFETIDSVYPAQNTKDVQRLLKWLVFDSNKNHVIFNRHISASLDTDILPEVISIENEAEWPSVEEIPRKEQILGWLGCLVREGPNTIALSHLTVKEFLKTNPADVSSCAAQKYLVNHEDEVYVLDVSLTCLIHDGFKDMVLATWGEVERFLNDYPSVVYVVMRLIDRIWALNKQGFNSEAENLVLSLSSGLDESRMQRFLSMSYCRPFELWAVCNTYLCLPEHDFPSDDFSLDDPVERCISSPLHFAAVTGLTNEVRRLLRLGLDPDHTEAELCPTPLHLAICASLGGSITYCP